MTTTELGRIDLSSVRDAVEAYADEVAGDYDIGAVMDEIISQVNEVISPAELTKAGIIYGPKGMPSLTNDVHRLIAKVELDRVLESHEGRTT